MKFLVTLTLLFLSGCAAKKTVYPKIYIDPACVTEAIQLLNCDDQSPPHCQKAKVVYKKGCERVSVK